MGDLSFKTIKLELIIKSVSVLPLWLILGEPHKQPQLLKSPNMLELVLITLSKLDSEIDLVGGMYAEIIFSFLIECASIPVASKSFGKVIE